MDVTICLNVTRQKKIIIYLDFNAKKEKKIITRYPVEN